MATLTGTQIANTYKQLLQVGSGNNGLTASVQTVQDGQGNNSALQLSQSAVNIDGTFQLNGITLTANASALNNIADLTGATGIIAVSGGSVYGRTLTGGTGVSITNADGTEGNPTIALNPTGVVSASYGPATNIEINSVGQIVSAGAATSVSVSGVTANTFTGGTFAGTTGDFSSNVSVGGNLILAGQFSPASLSVTGTINAAKISATDATFNSIVSAGFFVGDGSGLVNVPSAEGGTLKAITAGTGIKLTIDAAVTTTIPVSGTVAVSANQNFGSVSVSTALAVTGSALFGIVSATNIDTDELLIAGVSAATVTEVAAVSALTQTNLDSITSINTVVANVSALTSVNAAAITSINGVIEGNVSADSGTFNTLTVVTSASVGGTFNVGGNVGIGTSSPTGLLTIGSGIPRIDLLEADGSAGFDTTTILRGADVLYIQTRNNGSFVAHNYIMTTNASGASSHQWRIANSEKMRIDSSGNVGIGTTSPATPLEVVGVIRSSGTSPVISVLDTNAGTDEKEWTFAGGNGPLDIQGRNDAGGGGGGFLRLTRSANNVQTLQGYRAAALRYELSNWDNHLLFSAADSTVGTSSAHALIFDTNNTERMRIDSSGNVGIGTSNPLKKLDVSSGVAEIAINSTGSSYSRVNHYHNGTAIWTTGTRTTSDYHIYRESGGGNVIIDLGNVGIGNAAPSYLLDLYKAASTVARIRNSAATGGTPSTTHGEFVIESTDANMGMQFLGSTTADQRILFSDTAANSGQIVYNHTSNYMALFTNTAESMRIDSSGNLLVGTTSATTDLAYSPKLKLSGNGPGLYFEETDASQDYSITALGGKFYIRDATAVVPRLTIDSSGNVGIGTSSPAKQLHITKAAIADIGTLTDGATITPDFDANQNFTVTLGGNRTLANPTNIDAGQTGSIFVVQDGTGSRTLSFGSYWKFAGGTAPTLSTAAGSVDRIDYIVYTTTAIHAVATLNVS